MPDDKSLEERFEGEKSNIHYVTYSSLVPSDMEKIKEELITASESESSLTPENEDFEDSIHRILKEKSIKIAQELGADLVYENGYEFFYFDKPKKAVGLMHFYRKEAAEQPEETPKQKKYASLFAQAKKELARKEYEKAKDIFFEIMDLNVERFGKQVMDYLVDQAKRTKDEEIVSIGFAMTNVCGDIIDVLGYWDTLLEIRDKIEELKKLK